MKELRYDLTREGLRHGIDDSRMPDHIKDLAHGRLGLAKEFISDEARLGDIIRPGRLVTVDLRDEYMEKDQALVVKIRHLSPTQGMDFPGSGPISEGTKCQILSTSAMRR